MVVTRSERLLGIVEGSCTHGTRSGSACLQTYLKNSGGRRRQETSENRRRRKLKEKKIRGGEAPAAAARGRRHRSRTCPPRTVLAVPQQDGKRGWLIGQVNTGDERLGTTRGKRTPVRIRVSAEKAQSNGPGGVGGCGRPVEFVSAPTSVSETRGRRFLQVRRGGGAMAEEAEGMDRFDMDGDFEGGRWGRDGEFYYQSRRERAPQTRDDALYGVFAEGDSDYDSEDDEGSRRRGRRKRRRDEPDLTKPVQFVSTGNFMPTQEPQPEPDQRPGLGRPATAAAAKEEEEDDEGDTEMLPTMQEEKEREREKAARRRQVAGVGAREPAAALGSLEANSKVAKMMAMMGYKKGMGLGKNEQGITAPVETTLRPKNAGLGSVEGFKEPKPMMAKENLPAPAAPPTTSGKKEKRWSKKASAKKAPVLTKNELLAMRAEQEQEEQPAIVQKVIDMRGPQARVLTDLRGLNEEQEMEANDVPMPELQYNVRLLVDEARADVLRLHGQLEREQEKVASLVREKEKVAKQEALQKRQLQVMERIAETLEQVRVDDTAGVLTLDGLLQTFHALKVQFEEEFKIVDSSELLNAGDIDGDRLNWTGSDVLTFRSMTSVIRPGLMILSLMAHSPFNILATIDMEGLILKPYLQQPTCFLGVKIALEGPVNDALEIL
nr:unnamed protein product [Digitaria exilis]